MLLKEKINPDHPTSNTNYSDFFTPEHALRTCFTFNGNSNYKLFAIFLSNSSKFLSDNLVTYSRNRSKRITVKKIQMQSEIKLEERTKVYYCFNSKGDNFDVNQL